VTFEEFAAARLPALLRYAHMLSGDPHEAQDLVQDTLVRVQLKWWRVRRADRPELYVRRMLTNVYLGSRRHARWKRDVLTDDPGTAGGNPATPDPAARTVERDEMWLLLARLPRQQRAVLVLRYYEGLTDDDIAEVLGCAVGTVRGYASRALATLRERLGPGLTIESREQK
jgi:RNA polymerase sigma-70 factor (sigma-E family)